MRIFGKNIVKRCYTDNGYATGKEIKPCEYYWNNIKLPNWLGKVLWGKE